MGFGSFFKKIAKLAVPGLGALQQVGKGDFAKALVGSALPGADAFMGGGGGGGHARPGVPATAEAREYFSSFLPEERRNIMRSLRGQANGMNDWFQNAVKAGAVQGTGERYAPGTAPGQGGPPIIRADSAVKTDSQYSDPYEAAKQARLGNVMDRARRLRDLQPLPDDQLLTNQG